MAARLGFFAQVKKGAWRLLRRLRVAAYLGAFSPGSLLVRQGWVRSYHLGRAVDAQGNPLPWFTYSAIAFLAPRLQASLRVFEYGSGSSTYWFAKQVSSLVAIDHNLAWVQQMQAQPLPPNTLLVVDDTPNYPSQISWHPGQFDLVVIDGIYRNDCCTAAVAKLSPGGVIILDNSEREAYAEGINYLAQQGFRRLDFWGMVPVTNAGSCTSFFYKPGNWLGI